MLSRGNVDVLLVGHYFIRWFCCAYAGEVKVAAHSVPLQKWSASSIKREPTLWKGEGTKPSVLEQWNAHASATLQGRERRSAPSPCAVRPAQRERGAWLVLTTRSAPEGWCAVVGDVVVENPAFAVRRVPVWCCASGGRLALHLFDTVWVGAAHRSAGATRWAQLDRRVVASGGFCLLDMRSRRGSHRFSACRQASGWAGLLRSWAAGN